MFGGTTAIVATGGSVGHTRAISVSLAGFAGADKLAVIALFATTVFIGIATDAGGAFGFSARFDLGGVVVVFGTKADGAAVELLIGTAAIFDTGFVFAKEAAAGLLGIRQTAVTCEQATGRTQARLGIAVVFVGAIFAGFALAIEFTAAIGTSFLALALAGICTGCDTTATTALFAFGTFGAVFAASDAGFGFGIADLATFAVGVARTFARTCTVAGGGEAELDFLAGLIGMIDFFALVSRRTEGSTLTGDGAVALSVLGGCTEVFFFATFAAFETRLTTEFTGFASAYAFVAEFFVDIAVKVFVADGACGFCGTDLAACIADHPRPAVVFGLFADLGFFAAFGGEVTDRTSGALDIAFAGGEAAFSADTTAAQTAFIIFGARGRIIGAYFVGATFVVWAIKVICAGLGGWGVGSPAVSCIFRIACGGTFTLFADLAPCTLFVLCAISTRATWASNNSDGDRRQGTQKHDQTHH